MVPTGRNVNQTPGTVAPSDQAAQVRAAASRIQPHAERYVADEVIPAWLKVREAMKQVPSWSNPARQPQFEQVQQELIRLPGHIVASLVAPQEGYRMPANSQIQLALKDLWGQYPFRGSERLMRLLSEESIMSAVNRRMDGRD